MLLPLLALRHGPQLCGQGESQSSASLPGNTSSREFLPSISTPCISMLVANPGTRQGNISQTCDTFHNSTLRTAIRSFALAMGSFRSGSSAFSEMIRGTARMQCFPAANEVMKCEDSAYCWRLREQRGQLR